MEFRNLKDIGFDTLYGSFERAFADYEIKFDKEEVRSMLIRRGYNPELSFAAFDRGEIVAFTLNGTGTFNGLPTAYDTGTGTVMEYRGLGLAGKIFSHSIPFLKEAGIRQYVLEVLQNNQKAIALYRRMNFAITREFDCFRQSIAAITDPTGKNERPDCTIKPVTGDFISLSEEFCDFEASWQNSAESIERGLSQLTCIGAFINGTEPAGFCVFDALTGDLTRIAVKPTLRRRGIGSQLLRGAIDRIKSDSIKVLNITSDNHSLPRFLTGKNIILASRQYEMILQL